MGGRAKNDRPRIPRGSHQQNAQKGTPKEKTMEAVIGNAGYGGGYGLDIVGNGNPPPGVPPYGYGFPAGTPFYPASNYGWPGTVNPFAALQMQQAAAAAQGAMMAPAADQVQGFGGLGFGGGGLGFGGLGFAPGCAGPLTAPLLTQRLEEPMLGLAPRCPTRAETQFVGFDGCLIQPGQTAWITASPCLLTKIIRYVIPSDIAYSLTVDQITVNGKDTLVNNAPVPAAMFIETATISDTINTPTIQPGCCLQIQVTNISDAPVKFRMGALARVIW